MTMFFKQLTLRGGGAPVRAYMPELMQDVLAGKLDPSPVFDMTVDGVPAGYSAMDSREALKVLALKQSSSSITKGSGRCKSEP